MSDNSKYLVIVESPSKAKTIGKYLGTDYEVKASMGHLRDLPKSTIGVDIENDFEPVYQPLKGKEDVINSLKRSAKNAECVYLATDPDREGEAISWHLKHLLNLTDEKAKRVTFNEITRKVVQESIQNPREIDLDLVDAQQARRILDRLVGYEISPVMWKKIKPKLSAGRVQSVAVRMVDDRDREIEEFVAEEYWTLDANLLYENAGFAARYQGRSGKKNDHRSADEVAEVIAATENADFVVKSVKQSDKQRSPAPPFTTSTMQQEASRKLAMTPRRTMAIAQQLYEGIDVTGEGTVGLITYMRTDSVRISEEARADAKRFIEEKYGKEYFPASARYYKTKGTAQDAHEAIRPSNVYLTPERLKKDLTSDQWRLYNLIWNRYVACQMAAAIYDSTAVEIEADEYRFSASSSSLKFKGYTAVYVEGRDDEEKEENLSPLPALKEGQVLKLKDFSNEQHFTQPPAHYTDATLIRAMEEQGIGRPSTYAPTVSNILDKAYVKKDGKYLLVTNLGKAVTIWMKNYFADIEDLQFTAGMEQKLDKVEEGEMPWKQILREFYADLQKNIEAAVAGGRQPVQPDYSDELCPECGKNLVVRDGKFGSFLGCPGYPECTFTMPLVEVMPGSCPKCGGRIMKRTGKSSNTGKQYTFYCCEFYNSKNEETKCDFSTWDVPVKEICPVCEHTLFKKSGKGRMKPFCINESCSNFLPEDQRGYYKKTEKSETKSAKKPAAKKTSAKKPVKKKEAGDE